MMRGRGEKYFESRALGGGGSMSDVQKEELVSRRRALREDMMNLVREIVNVFELVEFKEYCEKAEPKAATPPSRGTSAHALSSNLWC